MKKTIFALIAISSLAFFLSKSYAENTENIRQVYVLHGYSASVDDHWFQYLKQQLEEDDRTHVTLIAFPDSKYPDMEKWQRTLDQSISKIDQNSYFIAHSLGVITLLKFLERHETTEIGGVILVSGFSKPIQGFDTLDEFIVKSQVDVSKLSKIKHKHVFISSNDSIVPMSYSVELAQQLNSAYTVIPDAGHFLASDGYVEFPQVERLLMQKLNIKINGRL
ncbi:alpha/beta hydrolase [Acinetobacter sp. Marseille-Q1618]|uniref:RBBP9/YdeN family alpha/beta hydrolase n=1 Tax=Acinetobacter sp. Marseille-Q1618 TaxID=2697502 RepID=UPI0020C48BBF|nr:alpha/beta hydrolase [Acinetobacter sp. Marseille-Q1618]